MFTLISIIQMVSKPIQLYLDSIQKSSHSVQNNLVFKIQTKRTKVISCPREAGSWYARGMAGRLPLTVEQYFNENKNDQAEGLKSDEC